MSWMGNWKGLISRKAETCQASPGPVFKVVFRRGEDGYIIAECPQLPGCMSQGKTREEAGRNIADAIESVLAVRMAQLSVEPAPNDSCTDELEGEESFRLKSPELISV